MSIRFKNSKGQWFDLDPSNPGMARICLRNLSIDEVEDIDKASTEDVDTVVRGVPFTKQKVDRKKARRMQMQKAIVDWEGIYIGDDKDPAECNDINKVRIFKGTAGIDFSKLLAPVYDQLNESNASLEEARLKNSEDISSGKTD